MTAASQMELTRRDQLRNLGPRPQLQFNLAYVRSIKDELKCSKSFKDICNISIDL